MIAPGPGGRHPTTILRSALARRSNNVPLIPSRRWRVVAATLSALAFILLDRVTKFGIQANLEPAPFSGSHFEAPLIPGFMRLFYVENRGAAFSMGEGSGWLFVLLAVGVTIAVALYLLRAPMLSKVEVIGLGMVVGGGIGNAIDRVLFGYVVDFLCTEFIEFPVFNVADIGITCGVAIAFAGFMFLSPANRTDSADDSQCAGRARRGGVDEREGGR